VRTLLALAAFALTSTASAQYPMDSLQLRVDILPSAPTIDAIVLRGDAAVFLTQSRDSSAYAFDRRRHRFTLTHTARRAEETTRFANAASVVLSDSLSFQEVALNDEVRSIVIKDARGKTIALRGPRVDAEKKWRRAHGLPETPVSEDSDDEPRSAHPTDWGAVTPLSVAIDRDAIWVGLDRNTSIDGDFALGGLLRVDRRSHRVSVVDDSTIMHSTIEQIEPVSGGYLINADGKIFRLDTAAGHVAPIAALAGTTQMTVANDTAFAARSDEMIVMSLRDGKALRKGFRLTVEKDSITYAVADRTVAPSWDTLAVLGAAEELKIKNFGEFFRAGLHVVKADALEYYYPGDRNTGLEPIGYADTAQGAEYPRTGPNALIISGLDNPRLRRFLLDALTEPGGYEQLTIAKILLTRADTAAIPALRAALTNWKGSYRAEFATALALLGDTTGNRWIHASLFDTLHSSGELDTAVKIHSFTFTAAGKVRDPENVDRLLDLSTHPIYRWSATEALLEYRSANVAQRLLNRIVPQDSIRTITRVLDVVGSDSTFPMTVALRDSVASVAKRVIYGNYEDRWKTPAVHALARLANTSDLPALIGALTIGDVYTYEAAASGLADLTGAHPEQTPATTTDTAQRAAAQRWWSAWYAAHRDFKLRPR
jgi:hypothetical protein